jgi:membrane protein involved in colicin uptake
MPLLTAQPPVPQSAPSTFRSASTSLDNRRQRRTAQVTAEKKIKQIAAVEKIYAQKASKEEKRKMLEEMQREDTEGMDVNDVGGRMRSMSLTPMAGGVGGGDAGEGGSKNAGRGGYETWLKRRATGDRNRYVVRSESAEE